MQIWDIESWQCQQSIHVPASVIPIDENQFEPTLDTNKKGQSLISIQVLNTKQAFLAVAYDNVLGLLKLPNSQPNHLDFIPQFATSFQSIVQCRDIHHLQSNNQSLLAFRCHFDSGCVSNTYYYLFYTGSIEVINM